MTFSTLLFGKAQHTSRARAYAEVPLCTPVCRCPRAAAAAAAAARSRNRELQELFQSGLGLHHAGMLRSDRNLTERLFSEGWIKVGPRGRRQAAGAARPWRQQQPRPRAVNGCCLQGSG
jgi:hypothetical protein